MVTLPFLNRMDAARQLARALDDLRGTRPVVLAIPRGAVPMGRLIADTLGGELDIVLVRKIGAPGNPEFAIGAVDEQGGIALIDASEWNGAGASYVCAEADRQLETMRERRHLYRGISEPVPLRHRVVVVVDDGMATGATMAAALRSVRRQRPDRIVCAVPVASAEALAMVEPLADRTVCLAVPMPFRAVGRCYLDFPQVDDAAVREALGTAPDQRPDATRSPSLISSPG